MTYIIFGIHVGTNLLKEFEGPSVTKVGGQGGIYIKYPYGQKSMVYRCADFFCVLGVYSAYIA